MPCFKVGAITVIIFCSLVVEQIQNAFIKSVNSFHFVLIYLPFLLLLFWEILRTATLTKTFKSTLLLLFF